MTNREKLNAMTDEEFAEWLCQQVWDDYGRDPLLSAMRFNHIRNFLKREVEHETDNRKE